MVGIPVNPSSLLTGTVTNGTYSHANNTTEQDVLNFVATKQKIELYLDMSNITQNTIIREHIKVDGTTYRQISQKHIQSILILTQKQFQYQLNSQIVTIK